MYTNIAAYKFITLNEDELPPLCKQLKATGSRLALKGTILLGTEGINLFLAGEQENIKAYQDFLATYVSFQDLPYKYSYSSFIPFKKLFVKIRREIVTFNQAQIKPQEFTAPYLMPEEVKKRLDNKEKLVLLDTRNSFEYEMGTFENAIQLNINNFREFPTALDQCNLEKNEPIVTFCTGGIRCEKAAAYLLEKGFKEVYQLQGGILNYFEKCGGAHYKGDCFVFDDRIALDVNLTPLLFPIDDEV